jgi:hypothetical protein
VTSPQAHIIEVLTVEVKKYYVTGPISGGTLEGALVAAVVLDALPISLSCYFHHFYEICAMYYK